MLDMVRFAFMSDMHVRPEGPSEEGLRRTFRDVVAQKPDFVVTGGDHIWDSLNCTRERMEEQWALYHRVVAEECPLPIEPIIGNHDVWGWGVPTDDPTPDRGKPTALWQLGLESRYRSFVKAGWRFIILDSVLAHWNREYTAGIDEEQYAWLVNLLRHHEDLPVVILSHIPILTVTAYFFGHNESSGDWHVPGPWMHLDSRRLRDLFLEHPQVKLCLAGHMHQVDRVDYLGVTYMVCGSVSGAIWEGPMERCEGGYSIVTLHEDGRFEREFRALPCTVPEASESS